MLKLPERNVSELLIFVHITLRLSYHEFVYNEHPSTMESFCYIVFFSLWEWTLWIYRAEVPPFDKSADSTSSSWLFRVSVGAAGTDGGNFCPPPWSTLLPGHGMLRILSRIQSRIFLRFLQERSKCTSLGGPVFELPPPPHQENKRQKISGGRCCNK